MKNESTCPNSGILKKAALSGKLAMMFPHEKKRNISDQQSNGET